MNLYSQKFRKISKDDRIHESEVRVRAIGRREDFPSEVVRAIKMAEKSIEDYDRFHLTVAIGYGGRTEIVDVAKKLGNFVSGGKISPNEIDEDALSSLMYAPEVPDPDLVVRTSGEKRLSGFMLWHIPQAKLYFTEKYWPEFEREDLIEAVEAWQENPENGP